MPSASYSFVPSPFPAKKEANGHNIFPSINIHPTSQPFNIIFTYSHHQNNSSNILVCPDVRNHYGRPVVPKSTRNLRNSPNVMMPDYSSSSEDNSYKNRHLHRDSHSHRRHSSSPTHTVAKVILDPECLKMLTHVSISVPHRNLGTQNVRFTILDVGVASPIYKFELKSHSYNLPPLVFHISRTGAAVALPGARNPTERWIINQLINDPSNLDVPPHRFALADLTVNYSYLHQLVNWVRNPHKIEYPYINGVTESLATLNINPPTKVSTLIQTNKPSHLPKTVYLWNAMNTDGDMVMEAIVCAVVCGILDNEMRQLFNSTRDKDIEREITEMIGKPYKFYGRSRRLSNNLESPRHLLPTPPNLHGSIHKPRRWSYGSKPNHRLQMPSMLSRSETLHYLSKRSSQSLIPSIGDYEFSHNMDIMNSNRSGRMRSFSTGSNLLDRGIVNMLSPTPPYIPFYDPDGYDIFTNRITASSQDSVRDRHGKVENDSRRGNGTLGIVDSEPSRDRGASERGKGTDDLLHDQVLKLDKSKSLTSLRRHLQLPNSSSGGSSGMANSDSILPNNQNESREKKKIISKCLENESQRIFNRQTSNDHELPNKDICSRTDEWCHGNLESNSKHTEQRLQRIGFQESSLSLMPSNLLCTPVRGQDEQRHLGHEIAPLQSTLGPRLLTGPLKSRDEKPHLKQIQRVSSSSKSLSTPSKGSEEQRHSVQNQSSSNTRPLTAPSKGSEESRHSIQKPQSSSSTRLLTAPTKGSDKQRHSIQNPQSSSGTRLLTASSNGSDKQRHSIQNQSSSGTRLLTMPSKGSEELQKQQSSSSTRPLTASSRGSEELRDSIQYQQPSSSTRLLTAPSKGSEAPRRSTQNEQSGSSTRLLTAPSKVSEEQRRSTQNQQSSSSSRLLTAASKGHEEQLHSIPNGSSTKLLTKPSKGSGEQRHSIPNQQSSSSTKSLTTPSKITEEPHDSSQNQESSSSTKLSTNPLKSLKELQNALQKVKSQQIITTSVLSSTPPNDPLPLMQAGCQQSNSSTNVLPTSLKTREKPHDPTQKAGSQLSSVSSTPSSMSSKGRDGTGPLNSNPLSKKVELPNSGSPSRKLPLKARFSESHTYYSYTPRIGPSGLPKPPPHLPIAPLHDSPLGITGSVDGERARTGTSETKTANSSTPSRPVHDTSMLSTKWQRRDDMAIRYQNKGNVNESGSQAQSTNSSSGDSGRGPSSDPITSTSSGSSDHVTNQFMSFRRAGPPPRPPPLIS